MKARFDHTEHESDSIVTFYFEPEKPLKFTAGQFIELSLPHANPDERGTHRWFTVSSSPTEPLLAITTKIVPDCSTFKRTMSALQPGDTISFIEPMGDFVLPIDDSIPLLFVAGGIGITPLRSMATWLNQTGAKRDIQLIYTAHEPAQFVFLDIFQQQGIDITLIAQSAPASWEGIVGNLTPQTIAAHAHDLGKRLIYLSGPETLVEALTKDLLQSGIDSHRIVTDYFPGYSTY